MKFREKGVAAEQGPCAHAAGTRGDLLELGQGLLPATEMSECQGSQETGGPRASEPASMVQYLENPAVYGFGCSATARCSFQRRHMDRREQGRRVIRQRASLVCHSVERHQRLQRGGRTAARLRVLDHRAIRQPGAIAVLVERVLAQRGLMQRGRRRHLSIAIAGERCGK